MTVTLVDVYYVFWRVVINTVRFLLGVLCDVAILP